MNPDDLLDPLLQPGLKGFPHGHRPLRCSEVDELGWHVLAGDLPLPLAVLHREALEHNLDWLQRQARIWGVDLAPHGKTTMSPQLFARQLDAGAWGLTFANVTQLAIGVAAGARNTLIANQVFDAVDLAGIQHLLQAHAGLRVVFLVDSAAQLSRVEDWFASHAGAAPFEVLLEMGFAGGRTGCRTEAEAMALALQIKASPAVRLVGVEAYEGLLAQGDDATDTASTGALMADVASVVQQAQAAGCFSGSEVLVSAGGSALFDLVATRLVPSLGVPVRGLLRSGCYLAHDHGFYRRMVHRVEGRLGCACDASLRPALEVWALVQSCPEPGLAILNAGKRDVSFDLGLPVPVWRAPHGALRPTAAPEGWSITALNDQHAYLRWDPAGDATPPVVGERIALGISHPCTTFDKWHWMPIVEADYRVSGAVTLHF